MDDDAEICDEAPSAEAMTDYDRAHLVTYLRLLDALADKASDAEISRCILGIDPDREPVRSQRALASHLRRAKWMSEHGYRNLLDS